MDDFHLSTIFCVILAVLLMIVVPTYNTMEKVDTLVQNMVEYRTELFSNAVCSSGSISPTLYEEFIHHLDSSGYVFDVEMEHERKVVAPIYSEDGLEFTGSYTEYYEMVKTEEILDVIYSGGQYNMSFGDFITVTVTSRTPARSNCLAKFFLNIGNVLSDYITYTDGGMIWNEVI